MISPICFTNFSYEFFSVWAIETQQQISYWSKTVFFTQFVNWKRNHNNYLLKKIGIWDWWNHLMNSLLLSKIHVLPTTNSKTMNPNYHEYFDLLEQVLQGLLICYCFVFFSKTIGLAKKFVKILDYMFRSSHIFVFWLLVFWSL